MKKFELYVSNNNVLSLAIFESEKAEYETKILRGPDVYEFLDKLKSRKVVDIIENPNGIDATLIYKDCILNLNEYERLLNKRSLKMLATSVNQYIQQKQLKNVKGRKVKRKNKHIEKRIIATGLAFMILGSCALGVAGKGNKDSNTDDVVYVVQEIGVKNMKKHTPVEIVQEELINTEQGQTISINYDDRSNTTKANTTQSYYGNMITKYAQMYGVDPSLAIAIATQERGIHSTITDAGGATGLMQIQNSVWLGKVVSAYNFETGQTESFTVTFDKLQNVETNIKIGCMILQNSLQYMKYNTLAAIQCYNMGCGNMEYILGRYASQNNTTIDKVLENLEDDGWLNYRTFVNEGDQEYVEHVLSWMGNNVSIKCVKRDGTLVPMNVNNKFSSKKVY